MMESQESAVHRFVSLVPMTVSCDLQSEASKAGLSYIILRRRSHRPCCFDYKEDEEAVKLQAMIKEHGVPYVLKEVSGLDENSEITQEILKQYHAMS